MSAQQNLIRRNATFNPDRNYSYFLYELELKNRHLKVIPTEEM